MLTEKIDLYNYFGLKRKNNESGYLNVMVLGLSNEINPKRKFPAILVIPGGAYAMVSDREAEPVALEYLNNNFNTFILNYSVMPCSYPVQLIEAAMAMIFIRENAEKYNVDTTKIAAVGFSAGGHLCGCLATIFDDENILKTFGKIRAELVKPNAVILAYPVISADKEIWHEGSFINVTNNNKKTMEYLSLEKRINQNSVPAFIWHTLEDGCVPVENSMCYAKLCKNYNVPFELHIFEKGAHGLATCNKKSDCLIEIDDVRKNAGEWVELSLNWLKGRGIFLYN